MDRRRAEEPTEEDDEAELQPPREVKALDVQVEEVLPEGEVPRFDRDQPVQDRPQLTARDLAQGLIERQVEQLVEHQPRRKLPVDRCRLAHGPPPPIALPIAHPPSQNPTETRMMRTIIHAMAVAFQPGGNIRPQAPGG
jgi:hypothetical protein